MLNRVFNVENGFWTFANKVADMVILEILWLVFCIPVVTIGASTAAFWNVMIRMAKDEESYMLSNFLLAFRENFRSSTCVWVIQAAVGTTLGVDLFLCLKMGTEVTMFVFGVLGMLALFFGLFSVWLYPLAGTYGFTWKKVLGNAVFLTMGHLPHTISCLAVFAAAVAVSTKVPYIFLVLPVLACYAEARVMVWVFAKYKDDSWSAAIDDGRK